MPTVLVTGAGRGLGLEFARQYAADGWQVIACVRDPSKSPDLVALAASSAGRVQPEAVELTDHASIDALKARLGDRPIDVLINCAGTMGKGSFAAQGIAFGKFGRQDFADWEHVLRVNVIAPMKMAETFVDNVAKSEGRRIVTLTSVIGSIAKNEIGSLYAYRISKAGVNAMMKSMAIDLGRKYQIWCAPIHPGWVRTDMGGPRADLDPANSVAGMRQVIASLDKERAGRFWMYDGSELPW